ELAILEPEASLSPPVAELVLSEADASVPPPVAELLESLPTTPAALLEAEAAIDSELLEVVSALQRFDQADGVNDATASHHLLPESGIQPTSHLISSVATAEPQSLDDLANAIADALCAEFAPPDSSPVLDPAMSRAEQRAVAPQLKYPQLAPEPQATAEQTSPQPASDQAPPNQRVAAPDSARQNNHAAIAHADQFASFVSALSGIAMAAGHSRAAAVLPRLLAGKLVDCSALPDEVIDCLSRQNIAHPRGSCVEPSPEFIASSAAWGELLRGQSEDMSACAETLDHFA